MSQMGLVLPEANWKHIDAIEVFVGLSCSDKFCLSQVRLLEEAKAK